MSTDSESTLSQTIWPGKRSTEEMLRLSSEELTRELTPEAMSQQQSALKALGNVVRDGERCPAELAAEIALLAECSILGQGEYGECQVNRGSPDGQVFKSLVGRHRGRSYWMCLQSGHCSICGDPH